MAAEVEDRQLSLAVVVVACVLALSGLIISLFFFIFNLRFRNDRYE
jgi:hypothetical protein